ncbi:hypothetical protein L596_011116 [Steinernema carpocapsae]|nr:hypothetical protein L596_011116 [Steinernema carpocapsae]
MAVVAVLGIVASAFDYFLQSSDKDQFCQRLDIRVFRCFSLYTNIVEIMSVEGAKKSDQIGPIHCIRFFSICWVIIGHSLMLIYMGLSSNPLEAKEILDYVPSQILTNAYFAVDTFFFMSGLLLAYMWFKALQKNRRQTMSVQAWILFYVQRILRLSPSYYMVIFFYTFVFRTWMFNMPLYMTPLMPDSCSENYWINLLYLTNFIHYKHQCYLISWYLSTDLQIFLFTPLILIPFTISPLYGYVVAGLLFTASTVINVVSIFEFYFPPSDYSMGPQDDRMHNFDKYTLLMYDAPWIRCQIYIMGMILGYFLQTHSRRPKINSLLNYVLWFISFALMAAAVFSLYDWTTGTEWSLTARAVYSSLSKPAWGLGLSWIIFACFYGYGGPINTFMSWEIWVPLGRLSYSAYLIHFCVVTYLPGMKQGDLWFSNFADAFVSFLMPIIILTFFFSLFWSAAFEVAFSKLVSILIKSITSKRKEKNPSSSSAPDPIPEEIRSAISRPPEMSLKEDILKLRM